MSTSSSMPVKTHSKPHATRAAFNPLIRPYLVVAVGFSMIITVIGIPLAIVWFLGLGQW